MKMVDTNIHLQQKIYFKTPPYNDKYMLYQWSLSVWRKHSIESIIIKTPNDIQQKIIKVKIIFYIKK